MDDYKFDPVKTAAEHFGIDLSRARVLHRIVRHAYRRAVLREDVWNYVIQRLNGSDEEWKLARHIIEDYYFLYNRPLEEIKKIVTQRIEWE